jgi:hypothetical protein
MLHIRIILACTRDDCDDPNRSKLVTIAMAACEAAMGKLRLQAKAS